MIVVLLIAGAALVLLLAFVSFVQLLYLESLRLRTREYPALEFFKSELAERIGLDTEKGALAFSVLKHGALVLLGVLAAGIAATSGLPFWEAALEAVLAGLLAMLVAAYLVPQTLYRRTAAGWLAPLAGPVRLLALLVSPLTAVLGFLHSLAELGNREEQGAEGDKQAEEIEALIDAGTEEGIIEEEDRKLIQSVVAFGDKTVREVMTPRPNIVGIEQNRTLEELRQLVINEQYSRIPVYDETIDRVAGFVHVRDMFEMDDEQRERKRVKDLTRPILSVPETKNVQDLLREMQQDQRHMVIVIDEYGHTAGLATMEDLVEEVFGEIHDEHEPGRDVTKDIDGGYVVAGSFDLDGLEELIGFRPAEGTESTTVGGLVTEWAGRVPRPGEAVEREGIRLEVLASNSLRVEKVRASSLPKTEEDERG